MKTQPKYIILILLLTSSWAIIIFLAGFWIYNTGEKPFPAKFVFVLAGKPIRALEAATIYSQGLVEKVYISDSIEEKSKQIIRKMGIEIPTEKWITRQILMKRGVPDINIVEFGNSSMSTVEEAMAIQKLLANKPVKFMVVSSPSHVWRAKIIFSDYFDEHEFGMIANRYEPIPYPWWTQQSTAVNVVLEISKAIYYQIGGRFLSTAKDIK